MVVATTADVVVVGHDKTGKEKEKPPAPPRSSPHATENRKDKSLNGPVLDSVAEVACASKPQEGWHSPRIGQEGGWRVLLVFLEQFDGWHDRRKGRERTSA